MKTIHFMIDIIIVVTALCNTYYICRKYKRYHMYFSRLEQLDFTTSEAMERLLKRLPPVKTEEFQVPFPLVEPGGFEPPTF